MDKKNAKIVFLLYRRALVLHFKHHPDHPQTFNFLKNKKNDLLTETLCFCMEIKAENCNYYVIITRLCKRSQMLVELH